MDKIKHFEKEIRADVSFEDMNRQLVSAGKYEYFGLPVNQVPDALTMINNLLALIKPEKIIEFGTGDGGLSVLNA